MKQGIHPDYKPSLVTCACGASYTTKSTRGSFTVDVCGACHPFYTGKHKVMDVAGRVDKFRRKYASNPIVAANTATAIAAQAAADAAPPPAPKDS